MAGMEMLSILRRQVHRRAPALPRLGRLLLEPALLMLLLTLIAGATLLYSLRFELPLLIGREEGFYNDAPFVHGFHRPEQAEGHARPFRWSQPQAALRFENLPNGMYQLTLLQLRGNQALLLIGHTPIRLDAVDTPRRLSLLLPSHEHIVELGIDAQPLEAPGDQRSLGLALSAGQLSRLTRAGLAAPWRPMAAGATLLALLWLALRGLGACRREALLIVVPVLVALLAAIRADPLRVGLAPRPLLLACLLGAGAITALLLLLPPIARHLGVALEDPWRRWLVLSTAGVFVLALAGRFYPASMIGDINFHLNRFHETLAGNPLLISRHRGIHFPYPPALYLLLLPLVPLAEPALLLQISAAALTALALPAIYLVVRRMTGSDRAALAAALLYGIFPATYMPVWWSFDTHIFAQLAALIASVYTAWNWGKLQRWRIWLGLLALLLLVFLGHFGFFLNMSLLLGLLVVVCWLRLPSWRSQAIALALALIAAGTAAWLLFYSAYLDLFLQHGQSFAAGGMNAVNDRQPTPPSAVLRSILSDGFWRHYAVLPLLLAPAGLALLARTPGHSKILALVAGATFCVSLIFGSLPLLTSSTISTRWLMFSAWALAACGGVAVDYLWRHGRLSRLVALGSVLFVGWWGLRLWLLAMVYYVRPPEPF